MKRFISIGLVAILMVTMVSNAIAIEDTQNSHNYSFSQNEDGSYKLLKEKGIADISATKTVYPDMFRVSDSQVLTRVTDETYQLCDRILVSTTDLNENTQLFNEYNIPNALIEELENAIAQQEENTEFKAFILAPSLRGNGVDNEYESNYTHKGYRLKDYYLEYLGMNFGMVQIEDSGAMDVASSLANFTISAIGISSQTFGIFGSGMSALSIYEAANGTVHQGSSDDQLSVNIIYDKTKKYTSVYNTALDQWDEGCESDLVWMDYMDIYQYYAEKRKSQLKERVINKTFYTKSYEDAADVAIRNAGYAVIDSPLIIKMAGERFQF